MTTGRSITLLALLVVSSACSRSPLPAQGGASDTSMNAAALAASTSIRPEDMYARIALLAADSMEGRDTGTRGLESAAAYLASEHQRMGLQPAGESNGFYQRFPFVPRLPSGVRASSPTFAPNVAAVLRGSDPVLADEYVILSAHFDHVGIGRAINGDSIYNGADDNASGTSALLEVARAMAALPQRPRRSVIFLHVSGEEHGLLGSRWYSEHPTVPVNRIVANINVDMIGRNSPDSIVVIGKNYSSLGEIVDRVGARHPELGLTVSDDLWPQERFFFRSDHYNFARLEIPSVFFFAGVHDDYHEPSDEVEKIDPDKAARVARLIFHTALEIAGMEGRPTWDRRGLEEVRGMTR